jgi:hypothetical protein
MRDVTIAVQLALLRGFSSPTRYSVSANATQPGALGTNQREVASKSSHRMIFDFCRDEDLSFEVEPI